MSESQVHSALIAAYLESGIVPASATACEGQHFEPVTGQRWARLTNLPSRRDKNGIRVADSTEVAGILQIDLLYPSNVAPGLILADADRLMGHFDPHTTIEYQGQRVKIRRVQRSQIRSEPVWRMISIDVYYWANIQ